MTVPALRRRTAQRARVLVGTVLALVLTAVGTGCAATLPAPPPAEVAPDADCLADDVLAALQGGGGPRLSGRPGPAAGSVPAGFEAVRAVECRWDFSASPEALRVLEVTHQGDLRQLLRALGRPSVRPRPGQPCPAMAELGPELFLVAADGRAVRVAWPHDECGFRLPDVARELAALPVTGERVLDRPLR
ncbi:MAG: hypothetical protein H5T83_04595 [Actinotalea sp.]|nr:hypothetical protein [Actinotalea sp.]